MRKNTDTFNIIFMFMIIIAVLTAFVGAGGTGDAKYFMGWIENADKYGILKGFDANQDMYPPYSALVLIVVSRIFSFVPNAALFSIRFCTALFMIISCVVARVVFKNNKMVYILFFSTLLSVTNGYLDIFIVPFALIAYHFVKRKNYLLVGLFLCLMCLMKYQPLIIMPIVVAGFVEISLGKGEKKVSFDWGNIFRMCIGAAIPLVTTFAIYGKPFFWSVWVALFRDSSFIAPNGLNFGWLVQFVYEKATGALAGNAVSIMWSVPFKGLVAFKLVFILGYVFVFFKTLIAKNKDAIYILKHSFVVYILYYLFSTNVHENHFFVGVILAILIFNEVGDRFLNFMCAAIYMFNINLAVFYGIWGNIEGFNRMILGVVDPTVIAAFVNVVLGIVMIISILTEKRIENVNV